MTKDDLPSTIEIKRKAKLAGTMPYAYWTTAIAPIVRGLPEYLRQIMYARAYEVSMNIMPTPTMDNVLLPDLLKKPHRSTVKWNLLSREYGVDRRYIATAYLYALERLLAKADEVTRARLLRRDSVTNSSIVLAITSLCVSGLMDRYYIEGLVGTNKFDTTLGGFAPQRIIEKAERAAARQLRAEQGLKATANKYPREQSWAHWRAAHNEAITQRADRVTDQLLASLNTDPDQSPIKRLAILLTTVTRKRPPLAAVLLYAHKHVFPRLARAQRWDVAEKINAHAIHFANASLTGRKHATSRTIISRLTGTPLPDTPPKEEDSERVKGMILRCRGMLTQ